MSETSTIHDHADLPRRWGAEDRIGAGNLLTPATRLAALSLVETGDVVDLGHVIADGAPRIPPDQTPYVMSLTTRAQSVVRNLDAHNVKNRFGANLERIEMTTHVGTHIDALGHVSVGERMYNGLATDDVVGDYGLKQLGVENVPPIITRGVLLDVAGLDGADMLEAGRAVTLDDIQRARDTAGVDIREGDVVCIHTGWGALFMKDNSRYVRGEPGIDVEAAEWLTAQGVVAIAADNMAVEVMPNPRHPELIMPVHQHTLVDNGVYLIENLKLDELATLGRGPNEFCFVLLSTKLKGATGCPVRPVALF
ncbi:MAG: cyclase family protein [Acidimicrobiales bacterium]